MSEERPRLRAIARLPPATARRQADWIVEQEPWRSLGYRRPALSRYLARMATARCVWAVMRGPKPRAAPVAVAVATDGFLLGGFIALLAVRPEAVGQGVGQALVDQIARRVFTKRRWLFVSCDRDNGGALRFYRRLGFERVGRLPDLVSPGRVELLLRKSRPPR